MAERVALTGNDSVAYALKQINPDVVAAYPITPQTEIIETLAKWIDTDEMPGRLVTLESEHSMITAAGTAASTGVRVFSATSSQGLLYAMEMLYTVSGWRAPFVLVNVSRGLSAPITLEPDHNDILAARDSGFLQIHCASCQEVLDSTLMAYRLAEDERVRLPVIVNLDGFYLSFTREPVQIPDKKSARQFVGPFNAENIRFRASTPLSHAVAVLGSGPYSYFRYETHLAAMNGLAAYEEIADDFSDRFGRRHDMVEAYRADDAEYLFVMIGSFANKAREAVDRHLQVAGPLVEGDLSAGQKLKLLPKVLGFYALWYPRQWIPKAAGYGRFGPLAGHMRFVERKSRKLARTLFHKMVRHGAGLQRKQMLLFRGVDIGAELFAMAAVVSRVQMLVRTGRPESARALELADLFCRVARRRVNGLFRDMRSNDDVAMYRTARKILDGEFAWLEEGIVGLQDIGLPDPEPVADGAGTSLEPESVGSGTTASD